MQEQEAGAGARCGPAAGAWGARAGSGPRTPTLTSVNPLRPPAPTVPWVPEGDEDDVPGSSVPGLRQMQDTAAAQDPRPRKSILEGTC